MSPDEINGQFTYCACQVVIQEAAQIYTAELEASVDYSAFLIMGADEILCLPDERIASAKQRIQWKKYNWLQWAISPSDLTFKGCIRWLLREPEGKDECVTIEEVYEVLDGRSQFHSPPPREDHA
jgi:hypothetical protein